MSEGFPFFDIIFLAMIAGFIILRLRGVLGRRTGFERREPPSRVGQSGANEPDGDDENVISLPDRTDAQADEGAAEATAEPGDPLARTLHQIALADRAFDTESFLAGAKGAYEMIVQAFAAGDLKAIKPYLGERVYESFEQVVKNREQQGQVQETTLVGVDSAEIIDAQLNGRTAEVTIKFISEMVNATRDQQGTVVAGDPDHVTKVTDIWSFARNTRSRDPNWALVATRSPH